MKIFDDWSLYKNPQGFELIDIDFDCLGLSEFELNYKVWKRFFKIIKNIVEIKKNDDTALMYQDLINSTSPTPSKGII